MDEVGDAVYLGQIQRHSRLEVVRKAIVQLSARA
jgi:hypothetical protein